MTKWKVVSGSMNVTVQANNYDEAVERALDKAKPTRLGVLIQVTMGDTEPTYAESVTVLRRIGWLGGA